MNKKAIILTTWKRTMWLKQFAFHDSIFSLGHKQLGDITHILLTCIAHHYQVAGGWQSVDTMMTRKRYWFCFRCLAIWMRFQYMNDEHICLCNFPINFLNVFSTFAWQTAILVWSQSQLMTCTNRTHFHNCPLGLLASSSGNGLPVEEWLQQEALRRPQIVAA